MMLAGTLGATGNESQAPVPSVYSVTTRIKYKKETPFCKEFGRNAKYRISRRDAEVAEFFNKNLL